MSLVLDTGPILALLDRDDPDHARCVALVEGTAEDLVVPAPVLVEVDYWCRKLLGVRTWALFVEDLTSGAYRLFDLDADALRRPVVRLRRRRGRRDVRGAPGGRVAAPAAKLT